MLMPCKRRVCPPGLPVHVVQRGNNRQVCFADQADLKAYAYWLREAADKYSVAIHAWVFMTNHVHLLVTPSSVDGVSRCMQYLGRHYVRRFNYRYRNLGAGHRFMRLGLCPGSIERLLGTCLCTSCSAL